MEEIKVFFKELLDSGTVHGHIEGPKGNVIVCDTMKDWCIASGEMVHAGYEVNSPGGFGGSSHTSRQATWNKIWRGGTVCASVIERKILIFTLPQTVDDYCDVIEKKI